MYMYIKYEPFVVADAIDTFNFTCDLCMQTKWNQVRTCNLYCVVWNKGIEYLSCFHALATKVFDLTCVIGQNQSQHMVCTYTYTS